MIIATLQIQNNLYLVNQAIDVFLWSWIFMIMVKRVICRGFDLTYTNIKESIKTFKLKVIRDKFKFLVANHHYYSDILLLLAALIAICGLTNSFYLNPSQNLLEKSIIWIIFHKLITISVLIKYKKSQPKLFTNIKEEIKRILSN